MCETVAWWLPLLDWEATEGRHRSILYPHVLATRHSGSWVGKCLQRPPVLIEAMLATSGER